MNRNPPHWEVLTRLWDGLHVGRAHTALVVDLAPYDGSLQRMMVDLASDNSNNLPDMRAAAICWTGPTEERSRITSFLHRDIRTHVYNLSDQQKYNVPGLAALPSATENPLKPTYKEKDYVLTHPESDDSLPLCQTLFDEWAEIGEYRNAFTELVREHNSQFNPTGKVFKANKRAATDDAQTSLESRAVVLQVSQETKDSVMHKGNVHEVVGSDPPLP